MKKITAADLKGAITMLSLMRYFPSDTAQVAALGLFLERLCGDRDRLQWLVEQLVNHIGEWPGPAEVRGLFCSRFRPADGQEADCTLPGYAAVDGEAKSQRGAVAALPQAEAQKLMEGLRR